MLNDRGGYESDLTVTRIAQDEYLLVTGSAQATRDLDYLTRHTPEGTHCAVVDVTGLYAVLAVMGPRSRELLSRVSTPTSPTKPSPSRAAGSSTSASRRCRATRLTYVGELGWELYVPVEMAAHVYEALDAAGGDFGLADAGYYAIDSLRVEKGYRAWGRELSPDTNPVEAGLAFAVKLGRASNFAAARRSRRRRPPARRSALYRWCLPTRGVMAWGSELVLRDGEPVGQVSSAAFGHTVGSVVALAAVANPAGATDAQFLASGRFQVDVAGTHCDARASFKAPYDPDGKRIR